MADDRPEDIESSGDLGRPKRPAPTLDLEATAVSEKPAAAPDGTVDPGPPEGGSPPQSPPKPRRRTPWIASILAAAISGAAAAAILLGAVRLTESPGETSSPQTDQAAVEAMAARVAALEAKATTGAATPAASSTAVPDPVIAAHVDALQKSVAALREELAAVRGRSDRLATAMTELKQAPKDASAAPDLSAIDQRLAQIEQTTRAQAAETAQQNAKPVDDKPLRRVVAAALLEVSVRQGEPYAAALDAAKALAPDPAMLKPLDAFAATGVPRPGVLSRDLLALLPKAAPALETTTATGTGIVDRLQAGAARLVRIQRTDGSDAAAGGNDRSTAIIRAAAAAQRNDIADAKRELSALTGADRAAVQSGIDRLDTRDAALAASRAFAADAMAALANPAP